MSELAFCSYCFGDKRYKAQQDRLLESIRVFYPNNPCYFTSEQPAPPGARPMEESLYGFKPHLVKHVLDQGHKKIVFFDTPIILMGLLDEYAEVVKEYGVIAVQDENKLKGLCADKALKYFNLKRSWLDDKHLVGGSFYYFDFDLPLCNEIFNKWYNAEKDDMFGSAQEEASERLQGHRLDETIMSISLYTSGSRPYSDHRYNSDNNPVMIKRHFK